MSRNLPSVANECPYYPQTNMLVDQHLINMNIREHEFFYNVEEDSANEENPINEENSIIEEESSNEESSDEEVECQACHGNINTVSEVAVLHPCNHAFHFSRCIKNRFRKNSKCPVCGKEAVKLRRMSSREGIFHDLLPPVVKKQPVNEFLSSNLFSPSSKGYFSSSFSFPAAMLVVRRYIYTKRLFCQSITTSQYSVSSKAAMKSFKVDSTTEHQIRLWIRREVQALTYSDRNFHHLLTRTPIEKTYFEFCVVTSLTLERGERKATLQGLELFLGTHTDVFLHELGAFLISGYETLEEWDSSVRYPFEQPGMPTGTSSMQSTSTQTIPTQATTNQATPIQATTIQATATQAPIQAAPRVRPRLHRSSGLLFRYGYQRSESVPSSSMEPLQTISSISQENVQQTAEESSDQDNPHNTESSLGSELPQVPRGTFDTVAEDEDTLNTDPRQFHDE
ncbi:e4718b55-3a1a-40dc-bf96-4c03b3b2b35a [Sclerotinia trifoliorum]|uniref:E4718b55-3a1a-40dc-bf96-4c03b3b2b35a n=1 Tax=Sclerotinia trifoliorum TaxID=28548 RepID=A0A8H2W3J7_9HELO|nr:e4718b55-3a1a-40dc-bf96-4c03b3b2b35a [Sclerotinia trifoliorum]